MGLCPVLETSQDGPKRLCYRWHLVARLLGLQGLGMWAFLLFWGSATWTQQWEGLCIRNSVISRIRHVEATQVL